MKQTHIIKLLSILFVSVFMLSIISATGEGILTNTSLNDSKLSGTSYNIYVNITGCAASCYLGNVTYKLTWYNGTQVNLSTVANDTGNDTVFLYTWDTTALDDTNNVTLNFTSYNYAGATLNATNSTINLDIDNGFPTTTYSSSMFPNMLSLLTGDAFTVAGDADNTIGVLSCVAYFTDTINSTVAGSSLSPSSNLCSSTTLTPTSVGLPEDRSYYTLLQYTDGNGNSTNSSSRILIVKSPGGKAVVVPAAAQTQTTQDTMSSMLDKIKSILNRIMSIFKR